MELTHKIYKLVDANGKPAKFENIADLRILVEGWDFDIPVIPNKENGIKFFNDAAKWEEDGFEAFSIFEKFSLDNAGYMVHEGIHLSFIDRATKMELRIKEIVDPPFIFIKFPGTMNIDDESHNILTVALKQFYSKAIESAEAEVVVEEEPVNEPATLTDEPVSSEPTTESETTEPVTTEPVTTEPVSITAPATTEPVTTEPVATTEPATTQPVVTEPVATTEPAVVTEPVTTNEPAATTEPTTEVKQEVVTESTPSQLEEEIIPEEVLKKFEGYEKDLLGDGFEGYSYKNYRVFYKEVPEGELDDNGQAKLPHSDIYVLLLTPAGVMEIDKLVICDDESDEDKVKYQFKLKGEKKSAYINRKEKTLVVKKPKKKEEEKA